MIMSFRQMRVLIMFDLPVVSSSERRDYTRFRKYLIKPGFLMLQESIYCKLVMNAVSANQLIESIKKNKPNNGNVICLKITEKQFSKMEYIVGEKISDVLDSTERVVIL